MKNTILSFGLLFTLASCNQSGIFEQIDGNFDENRWQQTDPKTYEFTIDDPTRLYNITFQFSHVYGYQFNTVPLVFAITNPQGETEQRQIDLTLKDASGKDLGDCSGDYCDVDHVLLYQALEKGDYKVTVAHTFGAYLPNVLGVGLRVEEAGGVEVLGVRVK